jgi:hypothetical protein
MQADDNIVPFGIGELEGRLRIARAHYLGLVAEQDGAIAEGRMLDPERTLDAMQALQIPVRVKKRIRVCAPLAGAQARLNERV